MGKTPREPMRPSPWTHRDRKATRYTAPSSRRKASRIHPCRSGRGPVAASPMGPMIPRAPRPCSVMLEDRVARR